MTDSVYFVYLGQTLPTYAKASLKLAVEGSGLRVSLISNMNIDASEKLSGVEYIDTRDFYSPEPFALARQRLVSDLIFRNTFWSNVVERFFVLHQFARSAKIESVLHAELDQLLFRIDELVSNLDFADFRGTAIPFHLPNVAIASVFYCNDISNLDSLIEFASTQGPFTTDMDLLAQWSSSNPSQVHCLPTYSSHVTKHPSNPIELQGLSNIQCGGIVDAAQLGQWVGGADPRNYPIYQKPRTKYVDPWIPGLLTREELQKISFHIDKEGHLFILDSESGSQSKLFNLHLHSKLHAMLIKSPNGIFEFFKKANLHRSHAFVPARAAQIKDLLRRDLSNEILSTVERASAKLGRGLYGRLGVRSSSYPFISGDTFRNQSDHIWEKDRDIRIDAVSHGDVVFCEGDLLEEFERKVLDKLDHKIQLILGNSDRNFTSDLAVTASHEAISHIYCQNLLTAVNGCTPLPIGLENRWRNENGRLAFFLENLAGSEPECYRILWNFALDTNPKFRRIAAKQLLSCPVADFSPRVSRNEYRHQLLRYSFIVSPPGNGFDCHRTWEAIYAGRVPIVIRSYFSDFLNSIGLPIWVVDSYEELSNVTEEILYEKFQAFMPFFNSEAIWADYWLDRIFMKS